MANINEVMNKNKDPKWMTENDEGNQGEKQGGGKKGKGDGGGGGGGDNKPKAPAVPKHEFRVKMCCDKCEEKVREEALYTYGVQKVDIDRNNRKVSVTGHVEPNVLLKKFKNNVDKKACMWPVETKKGGGGGGDAKGGKGEKGDSKGGDEQKQQQQNKQQQQQEEYAPVVFRESVYGGGGFPPMGMGGGYGGYYGGGDYHGGGGDYQPKANYYSDYRPSQSYPSNFRSHDYNNQQITNPNYMKTFQY